jgi:exodeoxyribonuclease VII large subunit
MRYLTVTALTKYIKTKLEMDDHLQTIALKGEVSNFKKHSRGHLYFSVKDDRAQINAIMFAGDAARLKMIPKDGDQILVLGRISLYEPSGSYSIQVKNIEFDGIGVLYQKYEALKKELETQGYFSEAHKKEIPKFPKRIGVITSNTGAVIQDIMNTLNRRYRLIEVLLYPAQVQGVYCASTVSKQIKRANKEQLVDVLIVGRGGGSIEDLWGFNEREVADAIYHSTIPIISAVGHETDFTIADFVADLRAPTPTAAAELATPSAEALVSTIIEQARRIKILTKEVFDYKALGLTYLEERLQQASPERKLTVHQEQLMSLTERLKNSMSNVTVQKHLQYQGYISRLISPEVLIKKKKDDLNYLHQSLKDYMLRLHQHKRYTFDLLKQSLHQLSPLTVMDKGYGLIQKDQKVITTIEGIKENDNISVRMKDGQIEAKVIKVKEQNHG